MCLEMDLTGTIKVEGMETSNEAGNEEEEEL